MIKPFEFYFDFGSPYTFLAHKEIRRIERENSIKIKYMPILLAGLLKSAGTKANADIPIKGKYMVRDCKLWAEKYKIIFKFNNYFPIMTLNLMRCALVAEQKGFSQNFINKVFDAIWKDGINLNDITIVEKLIKNLDINPKTFLLEASDQKIKNELKKKTDVAFSKGIFGAPTFIVNNKVFWGQDRLEFVLNEAKK
ncbi:2-hydroxychromene-2-carboxylate isomerase [Pelagibacteraceae bacterium]|nr:2-hydroxychromene-2-carboxylate isomerase [Pelagibacteraceae bacterium]